MTVDLPSLAATAGDNYRCVGLDISEQIIEGESPEQARERILALFRSHPDAQGWMWGTFAPVYCFAAPPKMNGLPISAEFALAANTSLHISHAGGMKWRAIIAKETVAGSYLAEPISVLANDSKIKVLNYTRYWQVGETGETRPKFLRFSGFGGK